MSGKEMWFNVNNSPEEEEIYCGKPQSLFDLDCFVIEKQHKAISKYFQRTLGVNVSLIKTEQNMMYTAFFIETTIKDIVVEHLEEEGYNMSGRILNEM